MDAEPAWLADFRVCAWRTVSLDAAEMAALVRFALKEHPGNAVVVSCQRLEAYGVTPCRCDAPAKAAGIDAFRRLAEVAAGLDSVVLGEAQILGQVRIAFRDTRGPLRHAADTALAAAREFRRSALPRQSHAGHLLDRALSLRGARPGGRILVLGAGAMGRLIAERASTLGFDVTVAGRRRPAWLGSQRFIRLWDWSTEESFDLLVGCLGSSAGVIPLNALPNAGFVIDLGTPRNFVPDPGANIVTLADLLDDESRRPHAAALRARLRQELAGLVHRRLAREASVTRPTAARLRAAVETIRREEVARAARLHPSSDTAVLEATTRALVNRLFHYLTVGLDEVPPEAAGWIIHQVEAAVPRSQWKRRSRLPAAAGTSGTTW